MNNINKHIPRAYATAIKRGFFSECPECEGVEAANSYIPSSFVLPPNNVCPDCNGEGIDQNIPISKLIMDVIEEVAEARKAFRLGDSVAYRKSKIYDCAMHTEKEYFERMEKNTKESELADIIIVILSICGYYGVELEPKSYPDERTIEQIFCAICGQLITLNNLWSNEGMRKVRYLNEVVSLVFNICKQENIDIEKHIELKMKYNELREN